MATLTINPIARNVKIHTALVFVVSKILPLVTSLEDSTDYPGHSSQFGVNLRLFRYGHLPPVGIEAGIMPARGQHSAFGVSEPLVAISCENEAVDET